MITATDASKRNLEICSLAPVVPVLVVEDVSSAFDLGTALVAGGLPALEVTLRTDGALQAIAQMAKVNGGVVGAGTLLTPQDVKNAKAAGAQFGVSPGATDALIAACEAEGLPLEPTDQPLDMVITESRHHSPTVRPWHQRQQAAPKSYLTSWDDAGCSGQTRVLLCQSDWQQIVLCAHNAGKREVFSPNAIVGQPQ